MNTNEYFTKIIFKDSKTLISPTIYKFAFILIKRIFIKKQNSNQRQQQIDNHLNYLMKKINSEIIVNKEKQINKEYSKKNLENIFDFLKSQNRMYAGDILEGILIYIFSLAFKADKDKIFGRYLFSNLHIFKDSTNNIELISMVENNKIIPQEFEDLDKLFELDSSVNNIVNLNEVQNNSVFYDLIYKIIFYYKYIYIKESQGCNTSNKILKYINRGIFTQENLSNKIYNELKDNSMTALDRDITVNSIMNLADMLYYSRDLFTQSERHLELIKNFFIQVYIYYQNKNSPLMNYIHPNDAYEKMPFCYDIRGAVIEGRFSFVIMGPLRIEPRIEVLQLMQNNFRECGLYELGKVLLFNKNIKVIEINTSLIRNNYIEFLNLILGIHDNYSVEEINLASNYLKDISEDYLAKLISHFKGLKTLNLVSNEYKRGLASFFVVLKKLYRNGQSKLENLLLNKNLLDEASFYELGELLASKYCKLKTLYLNTIPIPFNINFLKKLKKNKSLKKVYLDRCDLDNNSTNDIIKIMSNTNIDCLYLFKNKITNFDTLLKILYNTKLIKCEEENIERLRSDIIRNIDLSGNEFLIKNYSQINILHYIIKETTSICIDISHILLDANPDKWKGSEDKDYYKSVKKVRNYLEQNKKSYDKAIKKILECEADINRNRDLENDKILEKLENETKEAIDNEKAKFPVFLREQARNIIFGKKYEEITNKVFKDNDINQTEFNDIENKILNYMILNRAKKNLEESKNIEKSRKLIII